MPYYFDLVILLIASVPVFICKMVPGSALEGLLMDLPKMGEKTT